MLEARPEWALRLRQLGALWPGAGEQAGQWEGVPGTRTPPAPRKGTGREGPGGEDGAAESGRYAGPPDWRREPLPVPLGSVLLTHRPEGLVVEAVGTVILKNPPQASNKVVLL